MSKARDIANLDFNGPDIDGGNIDGATIGASTAAAGSFTGLSVDGSGLGVGGLLISNSTHNHAALSFARSSTATARIHLSEPDALHTGQLNFQTSDASGGSPNLVTAMVIDDHQDATFSGNVQGASFTVGQSGDEGEAINIVDGGHSGHGASNTRSLASLSENVSGNRAGLWLGAMTNENTAVIGSRTAAGAIAFQTYSGGWGERVRISASGDVQVKGGSALRVYRTDNATYGSIEYMSGAGGLKLRDVNGDGMTFAGASSNYFTIDGATNAITMNGQLNIVSDTTYNGILIDTLSSPEIVLRDRGNSDTKIGTGRHGLDDFHIDTYSGNAMLIEGNTRRMGLGITAPSNNIHILGNSTNSSAGITIQTHDTANAKAGINLMSRDPSNVNRTVSIDNDAGTLDIVSNKGLRWEEEDQRTSIEWADPNVGSDVRLRYKKFFIAQSNFSNPTVAVITGSRGYNYPQIAVYARVRQMGLSVNRATIAEGFVSLEKDNNTANWDVNYQNNSSDFILQFNVGGTSVKPAWVFAESGTNNDDFTLSIMFNRSTNYDKYIAEIEVFSHQGISFDFAF